MTDKDRAYLQRMLEFSRRIQRRVSNTTAEVFLADENLQDMVLYAVGQVGENANAVSDDIKESHPDLLWNAIIGIRNRVFHSYGDIDMTLVYEAAVDHTPFVIRQLEKILD